ncbi:MAG: hypothetical protein K2Y28_08270 [Burkholderiaceae bacterium]|nr:hypothetical protein [Burkholderiaceae bacterium]
MIKLIRLLLTLFLLGILSACSGGGGSPGTVTGGNASANPNGKITLVLFDSSGNAGNSISLAGFLTARATVTDANGAFKPNVIVTFTLSSTLATLAPTSGTALTDSKGIAQIVLVAGSDAGALSVQASATIVGTTAATATAPFQINTGPITANPNGKIQVGLVDLNNMAGNLVTSGNNLTANAIVTTPQGAPAVGIVVNFAVDTSTAVILPSSGTALTNSSGVARVTLAAGAGTGAGTLTATATLAGGTPVQSKATFTVGSSNTAVVTAVNFVSASPNNKSIVIKGAGGNGRTEVALLTFMVVDSSNTGIANRKVNFSTQSTEAVSLVSSSGTTDSTGRVTAAVSSGSKPTTLRVIATVDGSSVSAISDTVAVTTGLPTQTAFTILREKANVEGFDFGNITNTITVLLADASGGVVANGTPVVFTTDSGAIIGDQGLNDTARCLTGPPNPPGSCFVVWRSQSPNKSIVTVTATATNGNESLTAVTQFTNSTTTGVNSVDSSGNVLSVTVNGLPSIVVFPPDSCTTVPLGSPQEFQVDIADRNNITTPNLTLLSAENPLSAQMTIFPSTVAAPSSIPDLTNVNRSRPFGTTHILRISPAAPCTAGTKGSVYLGVKSPLGVIQLFKIQVNY